MIRFLNKAAPSFSEATTDAELVARCRTGDTDAFGRLYDRHYPALYSHGWRMLREQTEAEDAAVEALSRAWTRIDQCDPARFRGWIFSIMHRICLDHLRDRPPQTIPIDDESQLSGTGSTEAAALDRVALDEAVDLLSTLPYSQRAVVAMKLQGLRYSEIAVAMGKSEAAVAQDYSRAIRKVSDTMQRQLSSATGGRYDV